MPEHHIANVIGPMSLDVGDMDGDGDIDIVVGEHNLLQPESANLFLFENLDGSADKYRCPGLFIVDDMTLPIGKCFVIAVSKTEVLKSE